MRPRDGPMRCHRPRAQSAPGSAYGSATDCWTHGQSRLTGHRLKRLRLFVESAATPAGTRSTGYGMCAAFWIYWSAALSVRRGRPDPDTIRVGDTLDFWRVELYEPNSRLRLAAEMKVPGRAWLEFEVHGDEHTSTITQTAIFDPVGLFGRLYWYALYPVHQVVFSGMLKAIARAARQEPVTPK